jgi:hypothetical protein
MEQPIIFSGAEVRAYLEGRKSQIRQAWRIQPTHGDESFVTLREDAEHRLVAWWPAESEFDSYEVHCPYRVGAKLWVRETFWQDARDGMICIDSTRIFMMPPNLNQQIRMRYQGTANPDMLRLETNPNWHKKPSIFMPRWASRILTGPILSIRVERLQEISGRDAYAEGVIISHDAIPVGLTWDETVGSVAIPAYQRLWDSLHPKHDRWADSPWVWRIEFPKYKGRD